MSLHNIQNEIIPRGYLGSPDKKFIWIRNSSDCPQKCGEEYEGSHHFCLEKAVFKNNGSPVYCECSTCLNGRQYHYYMPENYGPYTCEECQASQHPSIEDAITFTFY